ncbi:32795_t:CDS:2, partial [Gigaspora margarita]
NSIEIVPQLYNRQPQQYSNNFEIIPYQLNQHPLPIPQDQLANIQINNLPRQPSNVVDDGGEHEINCECPRICSIVLKNHRRCENCIIQNEEMNVNYGNVIINNNSQDSQDSKRIKYIIF